MVDRYKRILWNRSQFHPILSTLDIQCNPIHNTIAAHSLSNIRYSLRYHYIPPDWYPPSPFCYHRPISSTKESLRPHHRQPYCHIVVPRPFLRHLPAIIPIVITPHSHYNFSFESQYQPRSILLLLSSFHWSLPRSWIKLNISHQQNSNLLPYPSLQHHNAGL